MVMAAIAAVAFVSVQGAVAGGSFDRVVAVGANGAWAAIKARPDRPAQRLGSRRDGGGGSLRRLRPHLPVHRLAAGDPRPLLPRGRRALLLLARARLQLRAPARCRDEAARALCQTAAPPRAADQTSVRYRSRLLRFADANIFVALEFALERPSLSRSAPPPNAITLAVTWRGPEAAQRPGRLFLTPLGVYTTGHLFPLQRGPWCFVAGNLSDASVSLIEATARICR